jgi:hypothetical protein
MKTQLWLILLGVCLLCASCGDTIVWDDDTDIYGEDDDDDDDDTSGDDDDVSSDDDDDTSGDDDDASSDDDASDNQAPTAEAGDPQTIELGDSAYLNGSDSSDPDGDSLDFLWEVVSAPAGAQAGLAGETTITPTLTPDTEGNYTIELTVTDPGGLFGTDEVVIGVDEEVNVAPVADAGSDQTVDAGDIVYMDGTGSYDPNGDNIAYWWTVAAYPGGAAPSLSSNTSATPNFIATDAGTYVLDLVVNDGQLSSSPDSARVDAQESGDDPGCLGCASAYLPDESQMPPLRASVSRVPRGTVTGIVGLLLACLAVLGVLRVRNG